MDRLSGDDLRVACRVVFERYKACVKTSLLKDVVEGLDPTGPNRRCGPLFADITDYCSEHVRSGELLGVTGKLGGGARGADVGQASGATSGASTGGAGGAR
jgi:hypothetical protein